VDQLETYFAAYLPQFFYAMLAPLTLFVYLARVNLPSAVVLLLCVPLIENLPGGRVQVAGNEPAGRAVS
jgi:ABC-type transport system involved in cytochrome bd biosynthesis fused ATPase/permease subunit